MLVRSGQAVGMQSYRKWSRCSSLQGSENTDFQLAAHSRSPLSKSVPRMMLPMRHTAWSCMCYSDTECNFYVLLPSIKAKRMCGQLLAHAHVACRHDDLARVPAHAQAGCHHQGLRQDAQQQPEVVHARAFSGMQSTARLRCAAIWPLGDGWQVFISRGVPCIAPSRSYSLY